MHPHQILECVIYKDENIIVLNKPSGIPVHYGKGGGVNLEQFFGLLRFDFPERPRLAHRLDKDTSGCLILGRTKEIMPKLGKMFENGRVKKTYIAKIEGQPKLSSGIISLPLGKKTNDPRNWHMEVRDDGDEAITHYKMLESGLIELKPQTGRTHQLRVHMKAIGCPIVGDKIYGSGVEGSQLMLHAAALEIPFHNNILNVEAPLPEYFTS
jgi:tRNA pseudouridine32 synthase/23S rRNA pseudouridine746 synthase